MGLKVLMSSREGHLNCKTYINNTAIENYFYNYTDDSIILPCSLLYVYYC